MRRAVDRVLGAVGVVKKSHLRKASTPSIFSHAYSSGMLPALGSNQSQKNVFKDKYVIDPYNKRYRYFVTFVLAQEDGIWRRFAVAGLNFACKVVELRKHCSVVRIL